MPAIRTAVLDGGLKRKLLTLSLERKSPLLTCSLDLLGKSEPSGVDVSSGGSKVGQCS